MKQPDEWIIWAVRVMRICVFLALPVWPFFVFGVVMLGDSPNVGPAVSFFRAGTYYLSLVFLPIACTALWLDRKKARERVSLKYRFTVWLMPTLNLVVATTFLVLVFSLSGN